MVWGCSQGLGGNPTVSPVPLQAGAADNSCDLQGSPGGKHVHHSSPTTHTHTADGEAERLTCPRMSPIQRGRARTGARGSQGLYDRSYRAGRALERRKESPWSILAASLCKALGMGREVHAGWGLRRELGAWGLTGWRGPGTHVFKSRSSKTQGGGHVPEDPPSPYSSTPQRQNTHSHGIIT